MVSLSRYINRLKKIGLSKFILGVSERIRNYFFYKIYKFDYWHVGATYHLRPYKSEVVNIVNSIKPKTVIEIGCGLGDILHYVNASQKIGIDTDKNVIKAAKLLYKGISFHTGSLEASSIIESETYNTQSIDILIMINWTHNIKFSEIKNSIININKKTPIKYILADIINENACGYKYKHTCLEYSEIGTIVSINNCDDNIRKLLLVKVSVEV